MVAAQTTSYDLITQHIKTDPDKVKVGMRAITNSVMRFVKECTRLGQERI